MTHREIVLLVDDAPQSVGALVEELEAAGYAVLVAPDGVLLDITMDDMDGWETARRLRARGHTVPIIVVSANAFENQPERLVDSGCQAFVDKPVAESQLLAALQRHLQLEWVAELGAPPWALARLPAPAATAAGALPAAQAQRIAQLARLGHRQGVRDLLDRLALEQPQCAAEVNALRELAERFAWDALLERVVRASTDEEEEEEPT